MEHLPGVHSRNSVRLARETVLALSPFRRLRLALLIVGCACLGYFFYSLADQYLYQAYENWAFDQLIAGQISTNFFDFLRAKAGLSSQVAPATHSAGIARAPSTKPELNAAPALTEGDLVGRIVITRLNISAIVREGVSDGTLEKAVGHVPNTGLPGQSGNVAIAAHRDTLFRALKDIQNNDTVLLETQAVTYKYVVKATEIVKPTDVAVLRPDGGGLVSSPTTTPPKLLTMITCYPFRYVGSAPKRFIVQAELAPDVPSAETAAVTTSSAVPPSPAAIANQPVGFRKVHRLRPSSSHRNRSSATAVSQSAAARQPRKKGFWQQLFH